MKTTNEGSVKRVSISILICGIIVFWGFQVFGEEWTPEQKELWGVIEATWENSKQINLVELMAPYHEDAIVWMRSQVNPSDGRKSVEIRD